MLPNVLSILKLQSFTLLLACLYGTVNGIGVDNDLSSKICGNQICNGGNAIFYWSCCGSYYNECCWHVQSWFIVFLLLIILCLLLFCAFIAFICRFSAETRIKNRRRGADV
uniref:Uncharacterized protein n=1 Tax=Acrobeloides nanus TaxID=290746 RepID=A0A914DTY7_9BILA